MLIKDQLKRELYIKNTPERIVSLVPSQTELLVSLGLSSKIVGVTKFCVHPENIRKQAKVIGGTKTVNFKKIKSLQPDVILCNKEENTAEMVNELEKIAQVHISDIYTVTHSLELIKQYGTLFDIEETANTLAAKIETRFLSFKNGNFLPQKVAYFIWRKPWMVAGRDTFINHLLELNGWKNIIIDPKSRYPEVDLKQLKDFAPTLILLSSEPYPFKEKHIAEIKEHIDCRIEYVDGEYFSWYGSRLLYAFDYFLEFQQKLSSKE